MIGNNKYIAFFMAQKEDSPNKDSHQIEMILNEYHRYLKHQMMYSEATSILLPYLGVFNFKNKNGRRAARFFIKKLRKYKERRKEGIPSSELEKVMNERCIKQFKSTWKQIDVLRHVFKERYDRYLTKKNNKNNMSNKVDNPDKID